MNIELFLPIFPCLVTDEEKTIAAKICNTAVSNITANGLITLWCSIQEKPDLQKILLEGLGGEGLDLAPTEGPPI